MKRVGLVVFAMLAVAMLCTSAMAQGDNSVYFVTYYSNNVSAAPDAVVRVVNDGDTENDLWAVFFVFDDSQELTQCCSCDVTADGLLSEDVKTELTAYPLRNVRNSRGVIKEISSSTCFGNGYKPIGYSGCGYSTPTTPTPGLRSWSTHIQRANAGYSITETAFADSNLAASEKTLLEQLCYFDYLLSGAPCYCTPEDYDF